MQRLYLDSDINYLNGIHDSFIFGVLAFASLFFFFFFLIVKEKVYLYFSLYLMSLGIGRFNTNNEMFDVFFREYPSFFFPLWILSGFFLHSSLFTLYVTCSIQNIICRGGINFYMALTICML